MNATKWLAGAAVVQAVLAVVMWWPREVVVTGTAAVFEAADDTVTRVTVATSGPDATSVTLAREGSGWVVASADNYPAQTESVTDLLGALRSLQLRGDPIASQETSHGPLGVSDDGFTRRVEVEAGGRTTTLLVGSGAGSSLNVRRAGEAAVYRATGPTLADFAAAAGSYVDTAWIELAADSLASITIENASGRLDLQRLDETWQLAQTEPGRQVKVSEVERITRALSSLQLTRPVPDPGDSFGASPVRVRWALQDGTTGSVSIGDEVDGDRYARREGDARVVRVSGSSTAVFRDATASTLTEPIAFPAPNEGTGALVTP